jgi:hypothetical protein
MKAIIKTILALFVFTAALMWAGISILLAKMPVLWKNKIE